MSAVGSIFGGGDDAPAGPSFGPPPTPEEISDYYDMIRQVKAITVTGANGKKERHIVRLPRSPKEQERYDRGEDIIARLLPNIEKLASRNPREAATFAPVIQTIANMNKEQIQELSQVANLGNIAETVESFKVFQRGLQDEAYAQQQIQLEQKLARKGLSDSSAANEARALLAKNQDASRQQLEFQSSMLGETLADQKFGRNAKVFGLNELGRQSQIQGAMTGYELEKEKLAMEEQQQQMALANNANLLGIGNNIIAQDQARADGSNVAQLANQEWGMKAADSLGRYNSNVQAQLGSHQAAMSVYANRQPSFLDNALQAGGMLGSAMFTSSPGSFAGRAGAKVANMFGI